MDEPIVGLTEEQAQRAVAVGLAVDHLTERKPLGVSIPPDDWNVARLAEYILSGRHEAISDPAPAGTPVQTTVITTHVVGQGSLLDPEHAGDWCDQCEAWQNVLPDGEHACGMAETVEGVFTSGEISAEDAMRLAAKGGFVEGKVERELAVVRDFPTGMPLGEVTESWNCAREYCFNTTPHTLDGGHCTGSPPAPMPCCGPGEACSREDCTGTPAPSDPVHAEWCVSKGCDGKCEEWVTERDDRENGDH